jgi:hypothetical protein
MPIAIEDLRVETERRYIGFAPTSTSVKPVHIANGLFRGILGRTTSTRSLFRFVFSQTDRGVVPPDHDLESVYSSLVTEDRIEAEEVSKTDLARLRVLLKKVVAADKAVFPSGMESYTAGHALFVSRDRIAQDGGMFVAEWLRRSYSPLESFLQSALQRTDDTITLLCAPFLVDEPRVDTPPYHYEEMNFFSARPTAVAPLWDGLAEAAACLELHFRSHPNKLFSLRLAVLFAGFVLFRHLSSLELCYVPDARPEVTPLLVSFALSPTEPVARASLMTYTATCQSIARFYTWAFGEYLRSRFTLGELADEAPVYNRGARAQRSQAEEQMQGVWRIALDGARNATDPFPICGQALYDLLATQAEASPITYLRQLGVRSGLLYPPMNTYPAKRLRVEHDTLEMLVRGAIAPGETIDMPKLQERLWTRYGIVVGGSIEDEERLLQAGAFQADHSALAENRSRFGKALMQLDFARSLADGVLQVELGDSDGGRPE